MTLSLGQQIAQNRVLRDEKIKKDKDEAAERARAEIKRLSESLEKAVNFVIQGLTREVANGATDPGVSLKSCKRQVQKAFLEYKTYTHPDLAKPFDDLISWAEDNDLSLKIGTDHDGMGMSEWTIVKASPKE